MFLLTLMRSLSGILKRSLTLIRSRMWTFLPILKHSLIVILKRSLTQTHLKR